MSALTPASRPRHPADFPHSAPVTSTRQSNISVLTVPNSDTVVMGANFRRARLTFEWISGTVLCVTFGIANTGNNGWIISPTGNLGQWIFDIKDYGRMIQEDIHAFSPGGGTVTFGVIETIEP